eukprot:Pgem_evm6s3474
MNQQLSQLISLPEIVKSIRNDVDQLRHETKQKENEVNEFMAFSKKRDEEIMEQINPLQQSVRLLVENERNIIGITERLEEMTRKNTKAKAKAKPNSIFERNQYKVLKCLKCKTFDTSVSVSRGTCNACVGVMKKMLIGKTCFIVQDSFLAIFDVSKLTFLKFCLDYEFNIAYNGRKQLLFPVYYFQNLDFFERFAIEHSNFVM